jgi:hypothetical protein
MQCLNTIITHIFTFTFHSSCVYINRTKFHQFSQRSCRNSNHSCQLSQKRTIQSTNYMFGITRNFVFGIKKFIAVYDMFRPTWTSSGNAYHVQNIWEETNNTENYKQDRHCTYNVRLRGVRESVLLWKNNKYYMCVCVCVCVRAWVC